MNLLFANKVALVTGASFGIDRATANAFAEAGASVALAGNDGESVRAAENRMAAGHKALAIRGDIADARAAWPGIPYADARQRRWRARRVGTCPA